MKVLRLLQLLHETEAVGDMAICSSLIDVITSVPSSEDRDKGAINNLLVLNKSRLKARSCARKDVAFRTFFRNLHLKNGAKGSLSKAEEKKKNEAPKQVRVYYYCMEAGGAGAGREGEEKKKKRCSA